MIHSQLTHQQHQQQSNKYPLCYLVHNLQVPMNVGSLFRLADTLGVATLYLTGKTPVPPNTKIRKTSRSAEQFVDYVYAADPWPIVQRLKETGYQLVALEITSSSRDIRELELPATAKICLLLGSENAGIDPELLAVAEQVVHIPMLGRLSSMNLATACAIATFEITSRLLLQNPA